MTDTVSNPARQRSPGQPLSLAVMVSASPWGTARASLALRFVRATVRAGHRVSAVYFRADGVYNLVEGAQCDLPGPSPASAWRALAAEHGLELLVCSADAARRLPAGLPGADEHTAVAGLATWWRVVEDSDRMVQF